MVVLETIWIILQALIGYNLVFPLVLYCFWLLTRRSTQKHTSSRPDYAFVVTAYQYTNTLPAVVDSILKINYDNYLIYIVADNCDITGLHFEDSRVVLLKPPVTLASNTKSHAYALSNFVRPHDVLTIVDSDNLLHPEFANQTNLYLAQGFDAVQGLRAAKNLSGTIAGLDAARDLYYHFYDGKLLFECGSSATLAGSGMTFKTTLYRDFLSSHLVEGAGFDKVLQAWIVGGKKRIAFAEAAVIYDEKTSRPDQLVKQRSRWINTWFKYFSYGFGILFKGVTRLNVNQLLFGAVLLRPPLFLFLIGSMFCLLVNLVAGTYVAVICWILAIGTFVLSFFIALIHGKADERIYRSLKDIPKFMAYQISSLVKARRANQISISTEHYTEEEKKHQDH